MADQKISGMTEASSLAGAELVEVVQGGVNKRTTTQDIADLVDVGGGGDSILKSISKSSHGFVVGNVLTLDSSGVFVKVTDASIDEISGVVTEVVDTDNFVITLDGYLSLSGAGLTAGTLYYATDTGIATPYPAHSDDKKVYIATSSTEAYMVRDGAVTLPVNTSWKNPVNLATTDNITLSGEQTIDGTLTSSSRVLVKDQTTKSGNGIYTTSAGAWTRTTDADVNTELYGAAVNVLAGSVNANKNFIQITNPITLGSTDVVWTELTGSSASVVDASSSAKGIAELATQSEANASASTDDTRIMTPLKVRNLDRAAVALTDSSTMDITGPKHTLATSSATRTFTISHTGEDIDIEVTLNATSSTFTFPAAALCVSEGFETGDNTCPLTGASGDKYIISSKKIGSNYYVVCKNFGQ